MARANVPKFGNWESDDNVPYTVYFEKARKHKGGKMINPNDPQENPDMFPDADLPPTAPPEKPRARPDEANGRGAAGASKDDGDFQHLSMPSENPGQRTGNEPSYGGQGHRVGRPSRPSGGSEQSFERSPLHPHYQAKVVGRGSGFPSWEGKSHDFSHGTPGRSKLRPTNRGGDESPEKGVAVPRFGEWNENDPQSAENFTHIFNKVREERNAGAGHVSGTPRHPSYGTPGGQKDQSKKCFCGWW